MIYTWVRRVEDDVFEGHGCAKALKCSSKRPHWQRSGNHPPNRAEHYRGTSRTIDELVGCDASFVRSARPITAGAGIVCDDDVHCRPDRQQPALINQLELKCMRTFARELELVLIQFAKLELVRTVSRAAHSPETFA